MKLEIDETFLETLEPYFYQNNFYDLILVIYYVIQNLIPQIYGSTAHCVKGEKLQNDRTNIYSSLEMHF